MNFNSLLIAARLVLAVVLLLTCNQVTAFVYHYYPDEQSARDACAAHEEASGLQNPYCGGIGSCPNAIYTPADGTPGNHEGEPHHCFFYDITVYCENGYVLNESKDACIAECNSSETFSPLFNSCVATPQEQNCKTQTSQPIDLIEGRKYRSERVMNGGRRFPFQFVYYYNNQRAKEISPTGVRGYFRSLDDDSYVAATAPPLLEADYVLRFSDRGEDMLNSDYNSGQRYGQVDQYWRHNFDDVLIVKGSQYLLKLADGNDITFDSVGYNDAYRYLRISVLGEGEETFAGYKLKNSRTGEVKKFDLNGMLKIVERDAYDKLILAYNSSDQLDRITNSEGEFIQLSYQSFPKDSIYSTVSMTHEYPSLISNNAGSVSIITWGSAYQGAIGRFNLISQITMQTPGDTKSAIKFEYNDPRWPMSITDKFFVADVNDTQKELVLHFDYDEKGRAAYSGAPGQGKSDTVNYVNDTIREVTNALGKKAVYKFSNFNGVIRLDSVLGEPTQNCVSSEVSYEYGPEGNVSKKIQNGSVTEYLYDALGRETSRTEASGTPHARTITTEYHPTWNKPIRIVEPGLTTEYQYDPNNGRLLNTKKVSTNL